MCLSIPGKVVEIDGDNATIDYQGEHRSASIRLKKDVKVGDYVIVNAKFVMQKVPEEEALKIIETWDETDES